MSLSKLFGLSKNQKNIKKEQSIEVDEVDKFLDHELIESISPFVFEIERDHIASGGNYIKPFVIMKYPKSPMNNWLSPLRRMKGNVTISSHYETASEQLFRSHYNEAIKNKEAERLRIIDPEKRMIIESEIAAARAQLTEAMEEKSTFLYLYTYVLCQAQSLKELKELENSMRNVFAQTRLQGDIPFRKIDEAYWATLPIGMNTLPEYTYSMTNSVSASSLFPFDDNEICIMSPTSTIEGKNKDTNSFIAVDYHDPSKTLNRNEIVLGTSGTGKSTFIGKKINVRIAEGVSNIYNIDPEDESSERIRALGGIVLDLSSSSKIRLNPFDIQSAYLESDADEEVKNQNRDLSDHEIEGLINQKIERMKGIHRALMPELTRNQLAIISSEAKNLYGKFREIRNIEKMKPTDFPILEDLYKALMDLEHTDKRKFEAVQEYCDILENCVYGSSTILNGHTNVDMSSKVISFNLKPLQTEKDMQSVVYLNTFSYLWEKITSNKEISDHLFCDEFHFLLKNPDSRDFFVQAYKRFRKYNAGVTVTTQQIGDILEEDGSFGDGYKTVGAAIVGNSYTKVLFGMEEAEIKNITTKLNIKLSKQEEDFLQRKKQSEALFMYGRRRAKMKVELTEEELRLFNPKHYQKITGKDPKIIPDWSSMVYLTQSERAQITSDYDRSERAV
ncbi:hypothetical protein BAME_34030 [Bacillus sp. M 2-6]|nr:hypothetical protein BAME_34030 [Bacillus sp. M 2-6]